MRAQMEPDKKPLALLVDDEVQMLEIISFALETQGFNTQSATSAISALEIFKTAPFDLLVLDVMLPDQSGIWLCRKIRELSQVPVILLTAKGEVLDRLEGLEAGADDYITKPFHPRELALRAAAIVRRGQASAKSETVFIKDLVIEPKSASVSLRGRRVALSQSELRLIIFLAARINEDVGIELLLEEVWGTSSLDGGKEMVKNAIYRLRIKLEDNIAEPIYIQTTRGRGYRLNGSAK